MLTLENSPTSVAAGNDIMQSYIVPKMCRINLI